MAPDVIMLARDSAGSSPRSLGSHPRPLGATIRRWLAGHADERGRFGMSAFGGKADMAL